MRKLLVLAALLAAFVFDAGQSARAQWCAYYDAYTYTCGFRTFRQCLATVQGAGGDCRRDYRAPDRPRRTHNRSRSNRDRR
jgi:hypothetical protein